MRDVYTAEQIRTAEAELMARLPQGTLMGRAAYGLARRAAAMLGTTSGSRVVLLVGAGDNGGDALWAGALLRRRGARVDALLLAPDRAHPDGLAALRRAGGRVTAVDPGSVDRDAGEPGADVPGPDVSRVPGGGPAGPGSAGAGRTGGESDPMSMRPEDATADRDHASDRGWPAILARADLVVDGIVGLSGRGGLRPAAERVVAAAAGRPIVAVDLPSGVDVDTGATDGAAVTASATVTFGALKPVHVLAAPRCGRVDLVDIGLGPYLPAPHAVVLDAGDVAARWPRPGPTDDKYSQGVVGVAAGSATYPGAAVLATGAAVLATSGMVRFAGSAAQRVLDHWPEAVTAPSVADAGRVQAWAVGPGIGTDDAGRATLEAVLATGADLVIDADAVTLLARHADLRAAVAGRRAVLTPHAGEFARIAGDVGPDRIAAVRAAAARLGVTVLLKGHATVVADPDGRTLVHPSTSSWAATAGSGDVLTGITGALLAAGLDPWWAAGCAAFVHARAAELAAAGVPTPASRLQAAIPDALRSLGPLG